MIEKTNESDVTARWTPDRQISNGGAHQQARTVCAANEQGKTYAPKVKKFKKKFNVLNFCTYNVRTLHEEHCDNFMEEVNDFKWDVIGLAETKLKQCFFEQMKYGHVLYNSGVGESTRRKEGVGFLIKKNH